MNGKGGTRESTSFSAPIGVEKEVLKNITGK